MRKFFYSISFYFSRWFYVAGAIITAMFIGAWFLPGLQQAASVLLLCLAVIVVFDFILLFASKKTVTAERILPPRFSNGDENKVILHLHNLRPYKLHLTIIDELPVQFQERKWKRETAIASGSDTNIEYLLKPTERGEYQFGIINIFIEGPLKMVIRHVRKAEEATVAVYPSYLQMRRFQLMAATNQLQESGSRQLRKLGQSLEFEQIREYVSGDDYRTINWKATARKNGLMVNNFMDERSQQVICLIDKGRTMKMPFDGMTLLDYAINATLVLSNMVLLKQDKAGMLTFGKKIDQFIAPDKKTSQLSYILETLYKQETNFSDSDFEALYATIRYRIKQRSLLILFTNFESFYGMERQLPYLRQIASHHPLLVVFFENTELRHLQEKSAATLEGIYEQTIANKFALEKRLIVKELHKHGIMAMLTTPHNLTANTINKYLELKARQVG